MANSKVQIEIASKVTDAVNGINSVNQKLEQMQKATESTSAKFARIGSVVSGAVVAFGVVKEAISKVVDVSKELINSYSVQETAEIKLQTVLNSTQNAIGMSASELMSLAESLSEVTTYSDQEILAVEQMLAATRKIGRDIVPDATMAILDMAAATGDDATGAAHDLAQALSDPAGEIESLKEKGIQLTEKQAENIKKVQEQNGLYEAQKLLLKEVESTYGGMAKAIADTDTGKLEKIANTFTNIKEGLGEGLLDLISPALDTLYKRLQDIEKLINGWNDRKEIFDAIENGQSLSGFSRNSLEYALDITLKQQMPYSEKEKRKNAINDALKQLDFQDHWNAVDEHFGGRQKIKVASDYIETPKAEDTVEPEGGTSTEPKTISPAEAFLNSNRSLSLSAQRDDIEKRIREANVYAQTSTDPKQVKYFEEISASLVEQRKALHEASKETEEYIEAQESAISALSIMDEVNTYTSALMDFTSALGSLFETMADNAKSALEEIEEKWDEYFEKLDEKQDKQRDSLNAMLSSGNISYQDYITALNDMDEERAEKEKEAQEEEEEARKKADELNKQAFMAKQANAIAEVGINAATAIMQAWTSGNAITAGIMTGLITATAATQIAAISAQSYTPLASGGIVSKPTFALLGEGGSKEAVLPLTDSNLEKVGLKGEGEGSIVININIGTSYNGAQLAEDVFRGIERAQRTGALPKWRYA